MIICLFSCHPHLSWSSVEPLLGISVNNWTNVRAITVSARGQENKSNSSSSCDLFQLRFDSGVGSKLDQIQIVAC